MVDNRKALSLLTVIHMRIQFFKKNFILILILASILHGLLYVFLIPPWQHYDEPGHVEYASLIAKEGRINNLTRDNALLREILASMIDAEFYREFPSPPDLESLPDPVYIGIPQVGDPPLYYILAALPIRLLKLDPINSQLYAMRILSLIFYVLTILISFLFSRIIFDKHPFAKIILPLFILFLPGLADLMTAASNDSPAIFLGAFFVFLAFKMIKNGFHGQEGTLLLITAAAIYFTKSSIWPILILLPIILIFSLFPKKKVVAWILFLGGLVAGLAVVLDYGDAALWYRDTEQTENTRVSFSQNSYAGYAIQLKLEPDEEYALYQKIPATEYDRIAGKKMILGAWIWADKSVTVQLPYLLVKERNHAGVAIAQEQAEISTRPELYYSEVLFPSETTSIYAALSPQIQKDQDNMVYIHAPFLLPADEITEEGFFTQETLTDIAEFSEIYDRNIIRNSYQRFGWPRFSPFIYNKLIKGNYQLQELPGFLYILDIKANAWYLRYSTAHIFRTFWAKFGWGNVNLLGRNPYRWILIPLIFWLAGSLFHFINNINKVNWRLFVFSLLSLSILFLFALFAGFAMGPLAFSPIPVARFLYPGILVFATILIAGVIGIKTIVQKITGRNCPWMVSAVFLFGMVVLDIMSIISLIATYHA